MTGAELADALEDLFKRRPDVSRGKSGHILRGRRDLIGDLRKYKFPKPETVKKILDFIANPPPESLYIPKEQRRRPRPNPEAGQRRAAAMRRTIARKAAALLDGDTSVLTSNGRASAAISAAAIAIRQQRAAQSRLDDPIEQALLKVRKKRIVFRASVYGGAHNRFYISGRGRETISEDELLQLARKVA